MNTLDILLAQIKSNPETLEFQLVIDTINEHYDYTPVQFSNVSVISKAGENEGSCKIFAFAQLHDLDKTQTLNCFGQYYRDDVLNHPDNTDHANIRNFIKYSWDHITFDATALAIKAK